MADFKTHTTDTAPEDAKPLLAKAQSAYGFVPNLLATMATSPQLLEAYMAVVGILGKSSFAETERQIVMMTNSRLNGCDYCMAAHTTLSQMAKVDAGIIEALRTGSAIADPKLEALRKFAAIVNETRGWPEKSDVQDFLSAGYTEEAVMNVVLATAFKVMSNYTNHIAKTPVDAAFAPNAWTKAAA